MALSCLTLAWQSLRIRVGCFGTLIFPSRWKVCALLEKYDNLSDNATKKARAKNFFPSHESISATRPLFRLQYLPQIAIEGCEQFFVPQS